METNELTFTSREDITALLKHLDDTSVAYIYVDYAALKIVITYRATPEVMDIVSQYAEEIA